MRRSLRELAGAERPCGADGLPVLDVPDVRIAQQGVVYTSWSQRGMAEEEPGGLMNRLVFMVAVLCQTTTAARAASFDCAQASRHVERMICSDPNLSDLDEQVALAYRAAASGRDAAAFRAGQRRWLSEVRDKCADIPCLRDAYSARLDALEARLRWTSRASRCEPPVGPKSPDSVHECWFPVPDPCTDTPSLTKHEWAATLCLRRLIDAELEKRKAEAMKAGPEQVEKESRVQTEFQNLTKAVCDRYYACDGTMSFLFGNGCYRLYSTYRARQVQAINQGLLELQQLSEREAAPTWPSEAMQFAKGLCEMPSSSWKERAAPDDCVKRVLLDMEAEHLAPGPCP